MKDKTTRGKTARRRLALLDRYLVRYERDLLAGDGAGWPQQAPFVDVGFGEYPFTTLEAAGAFRQVNPALEVVGVDNDLRRVEQAREDADDKTRFEHAGFDLADVLERPARLIRAMNVLRQYDPARVDEAHRAWGAALGDGGLLVEGTSDKHGHVLTAYLIRRRDDGLVREALVFATDFERGFAPMMFRDYLPRDIRRNAAPGTPVRALLDAWTACFEEARARGRRRPPEAFQESAQRLSERREDAVCDRWMASNGCLVWRLLPA